MEKILIVLIIFAFLIGTTGGQITLRDLKPENIEIVENKITGNQNIQQEKSGSNDLYKIYREDISGNASINLTSDRGNIYLLFEGKITGNININVKSKRGNIHIKFAEAILGNPNIILEAPRGTVVFYNDVNTIGNAKISVNSLNVKYSSGNPIKY